jgi:hypothetical protein
MITFEIRIIRVEYDINEYPEYESAFIEEAYKIINGHQLNCNDDELEVLNMNTELIQNFIQNDQGR